MGVPLAVKEGRSSQGTAAPPWPGVEFERREILVRQDKGNKDRVSVLPENLIAPLRQLERTRALHSQDLAAGQGEVWLPDALASSSAELLGHSDVRTTQFYTHVLNRGGRGVPSPLDAI